MTQLDHEGIRWEVQPGFEALARAAGRWTPSDQGRVQSTVTSVPEFGERRFRLTRQRAGWWRRFWPFGAPLRRQWENSRRLLERGIPMVRPLAYGRSRHGECLLVTEFFDGLPLDEVAGRCPDAVFDFFNRLYRRGVTLRDPQPGDVVVNPDAAEVRLADLSRVVMRKELSESERLHLLAFVRAFVPLNVPKEVAHESQWLRNGFLEAKARRCLEDNAGFERREFGPLRWRVRVEGLPPEAERILRAPDQFLEQTARRLQSGGGMCVGAVPGLVLKRFEGARGSRGQGWSGLTPGLRAFCLARHLELAGVPAPRPLAATERPARQGPRHTYFLMEGIPGARGLRQWRGDFRPVIRSVAQLLGRLHAAGFCHENLKETNFVLDPAGRAYLVGFDGLSYVRTVPPEQARADLARVNELAARLRPVSASERRAFLRAYCRARGLTPGEVLGGPWRVKSLVAVQGQDGLRRA